QLAVATFEGTGTTRFEYLLHNHDFDPQIDTFSVPLNGAAVVSTSFRDLDDEPGNDWTPQVVGDRMVWSLPGGAPPSPRHTGGTGLDWGLAYNFTVVVHGQAVAGNAEMEALEKVSPTTRLISTLVPEGDGSFIFGDSFETGTMIAWSATTP
ncbi:MAG: hypothetical protein MI919_14320, partial [Holophagales bacterium]|nr:hypothetical protein [Holophagales bacterium]